MTPTRKIIHIDADCFYASVEMRDNPELAKVPFAVGGSPSGRGVVTTCNYEARRYGVRSALPSAHALKLCPSLRFVKPDFPKYKAASVQMREIFESFTDNIEPLSLDEAYLDVSESKLYRGSATLLAQSIRETIASKVGITVSAGVAPLKYLAKIASDWDKPDGLFTIEPKDVHEFVSALPLEKLPGVGRVTLSKLHARGLYTCLDAELCGVEKLSADFGKFGCRLYEYATGVDDRKVSRRESRKSLSIERTYDTDLKNFAQLQENLSALLEGLRSRCEKAGRDQDVHKKFVKLKFSDFTQTTMEAIVSQHGKSQLFDMDEYLRMSCVAWRRQKKPIRLIGVGLRFKEERGDALQLELDLGEGGSEE